MNPRHERISFVALVVIIMTLLSASSSAFVARMGKLIRDPHLRDAGLQRRLWQRMAHQGGGRYGSGGGGGGWDDLDVRSSEPKEQRRSSNRSSSQQQHHKGANRREASNRNGASFRGGPSGRRGYDNPYEQSRMPFRPPDENRINLKALEQAGFDHLYGLSPVLNALQAGRRDFTTSMTDADDEDVKPEAQRRPWLLVQSTAAESSRSPEKAAMAAQIMEYASSYNLPVHTVDKGVLNTLSNNRPHQGFVLRCGKLEIPLFDGDFTRHRFWLVLDQITDPQNLGALLRSAQFLQCPAILVCTKNSAPPSAVVSAASAGALESYGNMVATSTLPRVLQTAPRDSVRIIGAAATAPLDDVPLYDLSDMGSLDAVGAAVDGDDEEASSVPTTTVLVLGSEGHGLRFAVARACTEFCRIPGATAGDSLNVSVTGGIFLWHLLQGTRG